MKKFFTAVPLQSCPAGLERLTYQAVGNRKLQMDVSTSFPVLTAVNGYALPGEDFRLIAVMADTEATRRNCAELSRQLGELCERRGLSCPGGVETVLVENSQTVAAHAGTFQKLLNYVDDDDELFSCMTFGTKPLSQAMLLAVQYAYRVKRNASISCVVYGEVDRTGSRPWTRGKVYDMTALLQLDEIVHMLARQGVTDPKAALDALLFPGKEEWITSVFMSDWKKFDPAKGSAYGFFADRSRKRRTDAQREEYEKYGKHIVQDTIQNDSGEEESLLEKLPVGRGGDSGEGMRIDADVCALISAMLELPRRLHGRANNPTRHNYFRLFFTETVTACLHGADVLESFQKRERDMLAAMKLEFLDYFMAERCRTAVEIAESPLKLYGELVEGREMKETALPLPGDVYVNYLGKIEHVQAGLSAVSQQKKTYHQEISKWIN